MVNRLGFGAWALGALAGQPLWGETGQDPSYVFRNLIIRTGKNTEWSLGILDIDPKAAVEFPFLPQAGIRTGEARKPAALSKPSGTIKVKIVNLPSQASVAFEGGKKEKVLATPRDSATLHGEVQYMVFFRAAEEGSNDRRPPYNHVFNLQSQKFGSFVFRVYQEGSNKPFKIKCLGQAEWVEATRTYAIRRKFLGLVNKANIPSDYEDLSSPDIQVVPVTPPDPAGAGVEVKASAR